MSQTYIAIVISLLASVLPKLGVTVGSEELTTTVSVIITIASGLWALYRRYSQGDITIAGIRKR